MSIQGRRIKVSLWHVFLLVASTAWATDFFVTNTNNSGLGSLANAVAGANADGTATPATPHRVLFNIPGAGPHVIPFDGATVMNPLLIDGTSQPGYAGTPLIEVTSTGAGTGFFNSSTPLTLRGLSMTRWDRAVWSYGPFTATANYFGLRPDGSPSADNLHGIYVERGPVVVGGANPADRNYFGNHSNAAVFVYGEVDVDVDGNVFGIRPGGTPAPNAIAIRARNLTRIGSVAPNVIAHSSTGGVLGNTSSSLLLITENSIYSNPPGAGIVDQDGSFPPPPVLSNAQTSASSTIVDVAVTGAPPSSNIRAEIFSNPVAEQQGRTFLGFVDFAVDALGNGAATATVPVPSTLGHYLTATATVDGARTSPFSNDALVAACPTITMQPLPANVCAGTPVTLVVGTSAATTYQWRKDGTPLANETNASLVIDTTLPGASGSYDVVIGGGCETSTAITVAVSPAVTILDQPDNVTVCPGAPATFTVTTAAPTTYQWRRNGSPLPGENSSTLTIPAAGPGDVATYDVVLGGGCAISQPATLSLTPLVATVTVIPPAGQQNVGVNGAYQITVTGNCGFVPTGTVTLFDGSDPLGTAVLSNGTATIYAALRQPGTRSITATYGGDSRFGAAVSPAVAVPAVGSADVPALSPWAFGVLMSSLAIVAMVLLRRQ